MTTDARPTPSQTSIHKPSPTQHPPYTPTKVFEYKYYIYIKYESLQGDGIS
jgi:hypothetical protein